MRQKHLFRVGLAAIVMAGGLGSTGCSTMNNTEKGAAVGGVGGAAVGTMIGAATHHPLAGALIGGLAGTAGGSLVGNDIDRSEQRAQVQQAQAVAAAQAQQRMLGITDVIQLSKSNMDEQVIINQIRSTGSSFQLSTADLETLQANGVSPRVIAVMQTARPATVVVPSPSPTVIYGGPAYAPPSVIVAPRPYYGPPPVIVEGYWGRRPRW